MTIRALVIEPDAGIARSIELYLRRAGMAVETTDNGEAGLTLTRTNEYSLALLSTNIQGNWKELLQKLRRDVHLPVLVLAQSEQEGNVAKLSVYDANGVALYPINFNLFDNLVQCVARNR